MLTAYTHDGNSLLPSSPAGEDALPSAVWLDLLDPTDEEEARVERQLNINIPTRDDMREVESSSQLYRESGASFIALRTVSRQPGEMPQIAVITLVLTAQTLVTVRYANPTSFRNFVARATKPGAEYTSALSALVCFAEALVDRDADLLEEVGDSLDKISGQIFAQNAAAMETIAAADLGAVLKMIGQNGDIAMRVRESLHSVDRAIPFLQKEKDSETVRTRLETLARDVQSLLDHAMFLTAQIQFLLDSSLGLISIQQNAIMKAVSIAAVVFLPPTLIGSIYGMNFQNMPGLQSHYGLAFALGLMVISATGPYLYFRTRKWL